IEVVAEDAQPPAGLGRDRDLADGLLERVLAALGLAWRQEAEAIGEDGRARRDGVLRQRDERRGLLEAGDHPTAGGVELGPPAIVVVVEVENIGGAGLDR